MSNIDTLILNTNTTDLKSRTEIAALAFSNHVPVRLHTVASTTNIKQALYAQFSTWKSVNYRLGGLSKNGIDCSGLVYLT